MGVPVAGRGRDNFTHHSGDSFSPGRAGVALDGTSVGAVAFGVDQEKNGPVVATQHPDSA